MPVGLSCCVVDGGGAGVGREHRFPFVRFDPQVGLLGAGARRGQGQQRAVPRFFGFGDQARANEREFFFGRERQREFDLEVLVVVARFDALFGRFGFLVPADASFEEGVRVNAEEGWARPGKRYVDAELERQPFGGHEAIDVANQRFYFGPR